MSPTSTEQQTETIDLVADIVSAYLSHNKLQAAELPALIQSVHGALAGLGPEPDPAPEPQTPAVPVRKSIRPDAIICLEDGKAFKSLRRHLMTKYGMTPAEYRTKWGLPKDYPMVAPSYAAARSALAKGMGLGLDRRKQPEPVQPPEPAKAPGKRGRSKKVAQPA
ncbi:transcriptional regulator [Alsobacter soli]|uniref:Transcriptional regulator n=1 Tax=Alsobacter soli TaxID=2109933 RepID=A0A2T1HWF7_9HYPH|nr:MucR family transcriptional regulator [Alsobacter soli]PSC05954.1 transcriptional regulator [Alsobacter soli]